MYNLYSKLTYVTTSPIQGRNWIGNLRWYARKEQVSEYYNFECISARCGEAHEACIAKNMTEQLFEVHVEETAEEKREYAGIYIENSQLHFECVALDDIENECEHTLTMDEQAIENYYEMKDTTAHYEFKEKVSKFRKVNQDIIENLKQLYNCRCQICGEIVGLECGTKVSQAHHIEYFSKSLNNDSDNIVIMSESPCAN